MKYVWLGFACCVLLTTFSESFAQNARVITEFNEPFNFAYLAFEKETKVADGIAHLQSPDGKGGAGLLKSLDLTSFAEYAPAIWAKVGPRNKAKQIKWFFASGDDAHHGSRLSVSPTPAACR